LPDLLITDVDLPGMDAFELVQALQEASGTRPIPPVVVRPTSGTEGEEALWVDGSEESLKMLVRTRLASVRAYRASGRILVIEDEASLWTSLKVRLERDGHEVLLAQDGEEGLQMLDEMPDLVLTDVDMPRLDGLGFIQRLRANALKVAEILRQGIGQGRKR